MIAVKDIETRAKELDALGVDYICVHTGYDLQAVGKNSFEDLATIKRVVKNTKTAVAGGIKLETLPEVIEQHPDLVIVGGGITGADDMAATAREMHDLVQKDNHDADNGVSDNSYPGTARDDSADRRK